MDPQWLIFGFSTANQSCNISAASKATILTYSKLIQHGTIKKNQPIDSNEHFIQTKNKSDGKNVTARKNVQYLPKIFPTTQYFSKSISHSMAEREEFKAPLSLSGFYKLIWSCGSIPSFLRVILHYISTYDQLVSVIFTEKATSSKPSEKVLSFQKKIFQQQLLY